MRGFRSILFAATAIGMLVGPAIADEMMMKDGQMMMMAPDGKMMMTQPTDPAMMSEMTAMMKKNGKVMSNDMIMMMMNGKMQAMPDMKMSDGKMMSEHMMMMK